MDKWRPIETAPKDGTGIIYYQKLPHDQKWVGGAVWHNGKFVHVSWENELDDCVVVDPTHWMPLPEPPEMENM